MFYISEIRELKVYVVLLVVEVLFNVDWFIIGINW